MSKIPELDFPTIEECIEHLNGNVGNVRVRKTGTKAPGIFVPPPGDSARQEEIQQVRAHFIRRKGVEC
tara:strand:+ start:57783 stop:57986 length:204 start_codon:yes stop_codon:yes gene_type:complete